MPTDYDAPRRTETDDVSEDSLEELKARRNEAASAVVDVDESESAENFELPGADLSGEELSVRVIPKQADEFTCSSCFLVQHRSRLASEKNGVMICTDCAACSSTQRVRADSTRCGWRQLTSQYGVGSSGSSRTTRTIGPTHAAVQHKGRRVELAAQRRRLR